MVDMFVLLLLYFTATVTNGATSLYGNNMLSINDISSAITHVTTDTEEQIQELRNLENELEPGDNLGDIILTQKDVDIFKHDQVHGREKRKVRNFDYEPSRKWPMPIKYSIDKNTIKYEIYWRMIKKAVAGWERVTCLKFEEVKDVSKLKERHLYFTNSSGHGIFSNLFTNNGHMSGCSSFIGKASVLEIYTVSESHLNDYSQPIYLENAGCFDTVGQVMHEIGHAVGLYHETQRLDRSNHIKVLLKNVRSGELSNFLQPEYMFIDEQDVPYDLGSLMQYASLDFSVNVQGYKFTSIPRDTSKVFVMGQRVEIGFYDAKAINNEYCPAPDTLDCKNGGYTDPLDWSRCRCTAEWVGKYCEELNPGTEGCSPTSGIRKHTQQDINQVFSLYSPNYLNTDNWSFNSGDECFWIIKAPRTYQVAWWLGTETVDTTNGVFFGMLISGQAGCQTWLEIKQPEEIRGVRLCGVFNDTEQIGNWSTPTFTYARELHISFRSFDVFIAPLEEVVRRGFHLQYKIVVNDQWDSVTQQPDIQDWWDKYMRTTPKQIEPWQNKPPPRQMHEWWKQNYVIEHTERPIPPTTQSTTTTKVTKAPTTEKPTEAITVKHIEPEVKEQISVVVRDSSLTYILVGAFIGILLTVVLTVFLCYIKRSYTRKQKKKYKFPIEKSCLCEKQKRLALLTPKSYNKEGLINVDVVSVI